MNQVMRLKVLKGRKAVDAYRTAHTALHNKPWHRGIPEEHTPPLNILLGGLKEQDFNSLAEFFGASEELNIQELGFNSRSELRAEIDRLNQGAEYSVILLYASDFEWSGVEVSREDEPFELRIPIDTPGARTLREALKQKWI